MSVRTSFRPSKHPSRRWFVCLILPAGLAVGSLCFARGSTDEPQTPKDLTELSLEELLEIEVPTVYAASRFDQKVTEAPSSVTIVTAAEIERYGYRTLADLLRAVRGFYASYDRNYTHIGVRGFSRPGDYNSRILLLVDGHRANDNIFDSVLAGTEGILDLEVVDRVEILRGPASSLYGTSAFLAVVNVVTRKPTEGRSAGTSVEAASYDSYRGRVFYSAPAGKKARALVSGSLYDSRGQRLFFPEFASPTTNGGFADRADADRYARLFGTVCWGPFTLSALHSSRSKKIPTASFGTLFNDPRSETTDSRTYLDLRAEGTWRAKLDWLLRAGVDRYAYYGTYVFDYPPVTLNLDRAIGWWGTLEGQASYRLGDHRITGGLEVRDNFRQDQDNYDEGGGAVYVRSRADSRNWSLYVQEEFDALERFVLNAGVRYDRYSTFGGRASPRLGLVYRPSPRWSAKLLYGEAFRAPNAFELYYYGSGPEAVGPETISTYEIAFDAYLSGRIYLGGSIYHEDIRDLISLDTDPASGALFYRNLDRAEGQGVEFEIGKSWHRGTELRASVAVQRAEDETTGELLSNSPKTVAHVQLGRSWFGDRLFSGLAGHFKGRRRTVRGTEIGSSATVDLTLNVRRLARRVDLAAGIYNLLDRQNADPGSEEHVQDGIPQDGRNFLVRLTYRF